MEYFFVVAGLFCLFFGGNWLVQGAISLSVKFGLPTFLISLTVVGFGTSMPELLVSVRAALADAPGIALGNVVGSNIANIILIIGAAAVVSPISNKTGNSKRDLFVMLGSAFFLVAALLAGTIGFTFGFLMVIALIAYLVLAYFQDRDIVSNGIEESIVESSSIKIGILLTAGLGLLAVGAELLVKGATTVASDFGVSNAVIGLTVVAVGTSLPELATSISAAIRRQPDIAIGNVIGSNIFNILGILGITALIAPVPVADRFVAVDGWIMLAVTAILFVLLYKGKGINRLVGFLFLTSYLGYIVTIA